MSTHKQTTCRDHKHSKSAGPSKKREKQKSKAEHKKQELLNAKRRRTKKMKEIFD